jgi:5-methylthioadenosine/S-adenosylhomocysteine deaminase
MTKRTVLRGARVLVGAQRDFSLAALDIVIVEGRILAIAPEGTQSADEVIDLTGRLLVPGLINGHFHSHEHFHKGRVENRPLELWMHYVRAGLLVELTPRQIYLRTMIGAIEALRSGTTLVVDDLLPGPHINRANLEAAFQAYEDIGIRAMIGPTLFNRRTVENFPFIDEYLPAGLLRDLRSQQIPSELELLDLYRDLVRERHPRMSRVSIVMSVSAPQRCSEDFMRTCRRFADEHDLPVITHVQETRLQVVTGQLFYGTPMVEYLDRIGFLRPKTTLIHAVWLNPTEIAALARTGATAQHNPWSNLTLGSGVQPVRELLEAGVNVSLGSDGTCSTMTANMLTVMGTAAAISKLRGDDYSRWLSAREVLAAATQGGAKALGLTGEVGVLAPGAMADLVGYRTDSIAFAPLGDPVRQLVYAERGAGIDFCMIGGETVMREAKLTRVNEAQLVAEIASEYAQLREEFDRAETTLGQLLTAMERVYHRSLGVRIAPETLPARMAASNHSL